MELNNYKANEEVSYDGKVLASEKNKETKFQ